MAVASLALILPLGLVAPARAAERWLPGVDDLKVSEVTTYGATVSWNAPQTQETIDGYQVWVGR